MARRRLTYVVRVSSLAPRLRAPVRLRGCPPPAPRPKGVRWKTRWKTRWKN